MKCPKCGYVGFEDLGRCRHCGYDFSLAAPGLPLFSASNPRSENDEHDELPLITRPSPPRAPLAVRRATPEIERARTPLLRTPLLDLDPTPEQASEQAGGAIDREGMPLVEDAAVAARVNAVAIDVLVLAVIDLAVVYLTMRICGLGLGELHLLPRGPLVAFLLLQNSAYFVAFTAAGQTIGKMATGIKVIAAERQTVLDLPRAIARELMWLVLATPVGLGLMPTLFSHDRRGLHDRFAGTRVVRAS